MSKIINVEENGSVLIISTEGYLNKDLASNIFDESSKYIDQGTRTILINLSGPLDNFGLVMSEPSVSL